MSKVKAKKIVRSRARKPATDARQDAFLEAYEKYGRIDFASQAAGIGCRTHYAWLNNDPTYIERFKTSEAVGSRALEDEAKRRAFEGSDRLIEFILKGLRPEVYGDRFKSEVSGPNGSPIQTQGEFTVRFVRPVEAVEGGDQ
jgi:hypothetical protein